MKTWILRLTVALAFSLAACDGKDKLCEAGDESCKVGNGKCVVGYDGDCSPGQVCYAKEGAPKGKPGTCTDGQFDASGQLIATAVLRGLKGVEGWPRPDMHPGGECFLGCQVPAIALPPFCLGKAPATLEVVVRGPHAETEELKASVRGVEVHGCERNPARRQEWECSLPENWVGTSTREPLELRLWTENTKAFPRTLSFCVDTQPLELALEVRVEHERYLNGGGAVAKSFLLVNVVKKGIGRGWGSSWDAGAWLSKVHYSSLRVFLNNHISGIEIEIPATWPLGDREPFLSPDYRIELPVEFKASDHSLGICATVSAQDLAGNEVNHAQLCVIHPELGTTQHVTP